MDSAFPVDEQNDLAGSIVHVHDDFLEERSDDTLAQAGICIGPERLELRRQVEEFFGRRGGDPLFQLHVLIEPLLHGLHLSQSPVPPAFEFIGHQVVLRICGIKLALGTARCVSGHFQITLQGRDDLIAFLNLLVACEDRCLYRCRPHHVQHLAARKVVLDQALDLLEALQLT
jgi:hypothetical protein